MKKIIQIAATLALGFVLIAVNSCSPKKVTRVAPDKVIDLSGRWNETDARLCAESLISQAIGGDWLGNFSNQEKRKPVVVVGLVRNNSHEHIETEIFIKDVEKAFLKSTLIRLVQAGEKRNELRGERADQQDFSSQESMKKFGKELGADFIMQGAVKSIVDGYGKEKTTFWQVDLELTNLETNEIVWIGDYKGKKYIVN
jgi:PBP1b-binding outer membrane lipoprotein LpoB